MVQALSRLPPTSAASEGLDPGQPMDHHARMPRFERRIPEGDEHERLVCADAAISTTRTPRW